MPTDHGAVIPDFLYGTAWKENRTPALTELALRMGFRNRHGQPAPALLRSRSRSGVGRGLPCGGFHVRGSLPADQIHISVRSRSPAAVRPCRRPFRSGGSVAGQLARTSRDISIFFCIACRRQTHSGVSPRTPAAASGAGFGGAQPPFKPVCLGGFIFTAQYWRVEALRLRRIWMQAGSVSPSRSSRRRDAPKTTASLWSLRVKLLSVSNAMGRVAREHVPDLEPGVCEPRAVAFSGEEFPDP